MNGLDNHPDITHYHKEEESRSDGTVKTYVVIDTPLEKQQLNDAEQERYDQLQEFLCSFIDGFNIDAVTVRPSSEQPDA